MSWATPHIEKLKAGETVQFRPRGHSMTGKISSGQLVTVAPITRELECGDIVLCRVKGKQYLHLIRAIKGDTFQIANNRGFINGWTGRNQIFGVLTNVDE